MLQHVLLNALLANNINFFYHCIQKSNIGKSPFNIIAKLPYRRSVVVATKPVEQAAFLRFLGSIEAMVWFGSLGGTSSLFITVLQTLIIAIPGRCMRTTDHDNRPDMVFLLAFRDSENGVEVTTFPATENHDVQGRSSANETQRFIIPGYELSRDCGDFYFRCQDILVTGSIQGDGGRDINVVFIPLENGVLLVSYWFDPNNATVEWDKSVIDVPFCNPTFFYTASNSIYTICINTTQQYIGVYEIQKLQQKIENATLVGPQAAISLSEPSSSYLSSFIIDNENKVYFADKDIIFMINVQSNQTPVKVYYPGCSQIHKVRFAVGVKGKLLLLVYCDDRYVYFDPIYEAPTSEHTYSRSRITYICPNKDYKDVLISHTEGDRLNLDSEVIYNVSIGDGICFEFENQTYFTYSDQNRNCVYIYKFSSKELNPAVSYECSSIDCPRLLLLDDHYLIVRVTDNIYVLDAKTNFTLIINTTGIPDTSIVTVIQVHIHHETYPTTVVTPFFTTTIWPFSDNNTKIIIITVTVLGTLIIVVILITIFVAIPLRLIKKRR